jgi:hypothetical protein
MFNWKGLWHNLRYFSHIYLDGLRKASDIFDVRFEIRIEHHPDSNTELCRYADPLGAVFSENMYMTYNRRADIAVVTLRVTPSFII